MAVQLHLYMNNPTEGLLDGTEISSETELSPVTVTLDASKAEEKAVKCAVRCDSGYQVEGTVKISFTGDSAAKWQAALDEGYSSEEEALASATWQESIEISYVTAVNEVFWVKAMSSTEENPKNDKSVDIVASGIIVVAEES